MAQTTCGTMMRAAVYQTFGGPIQIQNIPKPSAPPNGVVIQVKATGVCRSDWHGWKGHDDDIHNHGLPFVPGHEVSGIIVEVSQGTTNFKTGDRVAIPFILSCGSCHECFIQKRPTVCEKQQQPGFTMLGSFAEYLALPRADRNLRLIPQNVSFLEAAALGCRFTTAYRAVVQQGRIKDDGVNVVAVFGCGGLGLSCVMMAKCYGAKRILAVDINRAALEKARELGASDIVDASKVSDESTRNEVLKLTDDRGADLSIDAAGFASTSENAVWCTRRGGRMVQVGLPIGGKRQPQIPMGFVAGREIEIVGSHGFAASDMPDILDLVSTGKLDPKKLVEEEVTLEGGARAIEDMDHGSPLGITMVTRFREQSRL